MNWIGRSRFLDRDTEDWHFETWAWLMRSLGGMAALRDTALVTPSRDFFPPTEAVGHERALHMFQCVKSAMGMEDWTCGLVANEGPPPSAQVGEFLTLQTPGSAAGTFSAKDGVVTITYASDLVDDPHRLVSTLAHELAHYLLSKVEEEPPGGWELHELATELTVAYTGFGIFGANTAFHFEQFQEAGRQGWRSQRNGYLSNETWVLALATFLSLTKRRGQADKWLKPDVAALLPKADRHLARRPDLLEPLLAIS